MQRSDLISIIRKIQHELDELKNLVMTQMEPDEPSIITTVPKKRTAKTKPPTDGSMLWDAYATAYTTRYGRPPIRNAKANAMCSQIAARIGVDEGQRLMAFYLTLNDSFFVLQFHPLDAVVRRCEGMVTMMHTSRTPMTAQRARAQEIAANTAAASTEYLKQKYGIVDEPERDVSPVDRTT